jgi:hypothetical protein
MGLGLSFVDDGERVWRAGVVSVRSLGILGRRLSGDGTYGADGAHREADSFAVSEKQDTSSRRLLTSMACVDAVEGAVSVPNLCSAYRLLATSTGLIGINELSTFHPARISFIRDLYLLAKYF